MLPLCIFLVSLPLYVYFFIVVILIELDDYVKDTCLRYMLRFFLMFSEIRLF